MLPDTIYIKKEEFTITDEMIDQNGHLHFHIIVSEGYTFIGGKVIINMQILKGGK